MRRQTMQDQHYFSRPISAQGFVATDCVLNDTFCTCFIANFAKCPVPTQTERVCSLKPCSGFQCVESCDTMTTASEGDLGLCWISIGSQIVNYDDVVLGGGQRSEPESQREQLVECDVQQVKIPLPTWVTHAPEYNVSVLLQDRYAFKMIGDTATDLAGFVVDVIGDVNGDGFPDFAVGDAAANKVYVIYGRQNFTHVFGQEQQQLDLGSINGTNGFAIQGEESLGRWITAGDINGDKIPDIVVSAPFADDNGRNSGSVYVIFGVASGTVTGGLPSLNVKTLDGNNGFTLRSGPAVNTISGHTVVVADVNHDGFDDLLISSTRNTNDQRTPDGVVVYGRARFQAVVDLATLDGADGFQIRGNVMAGSQPGPATFPVEFYLGAADFNGDGWKDIVMGNPSQNQLYIIYARQQPFQSPFLISSLNQSTGIIIDGLDGDNMGRHANSGGDLNHDGIEDIITSSPLNVETPRCYILFGSHGPLPATFNTRDIDGRNGFFLTSRGGFFGFDLAGGGDVNGDGIDDLIIGANYDFTSTGQSGRVFGFYGRDQASFRVSYDATRLKREDGFLVNGNGDFAPPLALTSQFGRSVAIGDLNQDGISDILIAAPAELPKGSAYILLGGSGLDCVGTF